jgi:hypothetical protein
MVHKKLLDFVNLVLIHFGVPNNFYNGVQFFIARFMFNAHWLILKGEIFRSYVDCS